MKRQIVIHPLLVATYPILALLAYNIEWAAFSAAVRPLIITLLGAMLLWLILRAVLKDWAKAGFLCSLAVLLFFSYGHIYAILERADLGFAIGRHRYLIPLWTISFLAVLVWAMRSRREFHGITVTMNLFAVAVLAFPVYTLLIYQFRSTSGQSMAQEIQSQYHLEQLNPPDGELPDVYYIILDAYGRADILARIFDHDNAYFLDNLRSKGFYVVDKARSNYAQTSLSITSSTNMDYIQNLVPNLDPDNSNRDVLWGLIENNRVMQLMKSLGYKTVAFSTGLDGTDLQNVDIYYSAGKMDEIVTLSAISPFESMLIYTSGGLILSDSLIVLPSYLPILKYPFEVRRARTLTAFEKLSEIPEFEEPTFTFAHIIAPHPPFVFDRDGNPIDPNEPFSLGFAYGKETEEDLEDFVKGYREQLIFVNRCITQVIEDILAKSETPPIIILQADHGPKAKSPEIPYTRERMTILNAYYIQGNPSELLYDTITPVNTFRVVFDEVFGGDFKLLPDRVYFSLYKKPYEFYDLTDKIN
jgi:hypothetical protein